MIVLHRGEQYLLCITKSGTLILTNQGHGASQPPNGFRPVPAARQ